MMSLSANHPQITEFIKIKSDFGKINNANLSVEVDDSFMKAVKKFYETGEVVTLHIKSKFKGYQANQKQLSIHLFVYLAVFLTTYL